MIDLIVHLTCKRAAPIDRLCERLGTSRAELLKEIKEARKAGAVINVTDGYVFTRVAVGPEKVVHIGETKPKRHHVAHVTDIHFGSKYCDREALLSFLHTAWDLGCRSVACTGDVLDGMKDVLLLEQRAIGFDPQASEAVETLKKAPPFSWAAIDGNHDGYFSNAIGFVSGRLLETRMREAGIDWHFAGVCLGHAVVHGAKWELWHPHGGASTRNALRRTLNERAEALEYHVDILAMGHFHKYTAIPTFPEHVFGLAGGTFQRKRSEFGNRITRPWDVGASIVSYDVDAKGRVWDVAAEFKRAGRGVPA